MSEAGEQLAGALAALAGPIPERRLAELVAGLQQRYRSESDGGGAARMTPEEAVAYCAYRMPATYAAARAALSHLKASSEGYEPRSLLDLGGGSGAASMAAMATWPSLTEVTVLDRDEEMLRAGRDIWDKSPALLPATTSWRRADLAAPDDVPSADLVIVSYVLGEITTDEGDALVRAAAAAGRAVVVIEPGTPAGSGRVMRARRSLTGAGLHLGAPCPHDSACPMEEGGDWCHFSVRVGRSALHRRLKAGSLSYEDEKYSFVAGSRHPVRPAPARIVRHPIFRKGVVGLRLCCGPPGLETRMVPRSAGVPYRAARGAAWGDPWPPGSPGGDEMR